MALPVQSDLSVAYGGLGYVYMEERLSTGAALGSPDTAHKVSKVGEVKITYKSSTNAATEITAKTNAGEDIKAQRGYTPGSSSASAPSMEVSFNFLESSAAHLDFYATVRGKYYVLTVPLGARYSNTTSKKVEYYFFVQFDDAGDVNISGDKVTEVPVKAFVKNNSLAITTATNADAELGATTATISASAGYKLLET